MCKHNKHCNMLRGLQHALLQYTTAKPWALFYSQGAAAKHWTRKPVSSLYHLLAPQQHSLIEGQSTKTRNHTSIRGKKLSSNFIWSCQFQAFSVSQHQINKFTINLSTHNHQQSCFAPGWDFAFLRRRRWCLDSLGFTPSCCVLHPNLNVNFHLVRCWLSQSTSPQAAADHKLLICNSRMSVFWPFACVNCFAHKLYICMVTCWHGVELLALTAIQRYEQLRSLIWTHWQVIIHTIRWSNTPQFSRFCFYISTSPSSIFMQRLHSLFSKCFYK